MEKYSLKFNLPVSIIKEGDSFIAYTPALDLSTADNTYDGAKKRFEEIVDIFFGEIIKKGTLDEVLAGLGWKKVKTKWNPPVVVSQEIKEVCV